MSAWAGVIVSILTLVVANSLWQQVRVTRQTKAVEKRFEIYAELWKLMGDAAPMTERLGGESLAEAERARLYRRLTRWFFESGGGMVLGEPARSIYLKAKENLGVEDVRDLSPSEVRDVVTAAPKSQWQRRRRRIVVRQFSLLRTAMRADLGIFGRDYGGGLSPTDKAFLRSCGAQLRRRPWRPRLGRIGEWRRRRDRGESGPEHHPCLARRALREIYAWGDLRLAGDDLVHAEFVDHAPSPAPEPSLPAQDTTWLRECRRGDLRFLIEGESADGDNVPRVVVITRRSSGPSTGSEPEAEEFALRHEHTWRFADGKIIEHSSSSDGLQLCCELGLLPIDEERGAGSPTAPTARPPVT